MKASTLLILLIVVVILFNTKQVFWVILAALTLLIYSFAFAARSTRRGIHSTYTKAKAVYTGEMSEIEKLTGKYPAKFYDSVGKAAAEKINEHLVPGKAKSYKDTENFVWKVKEKNPGLLISDIANKILDSLGKIFSK
ncbi:MAG: hypothetical protein FJY86_00455 [Candidatus Diapherotrites archaeon]|uniref:Uncharacterized protein n=1 Tax=Candidatus Iainarchaeum sp. TaxID=3101447 RepID=A0A8T4CA10_9ARCH|nr:hypothetical protein [Candidatus Diapherotrites archaeon]